MISLSYPRASTHGPHIATRFGSSYRLNEMNEFSTLHHCHKFVNVLLFRVYLLGLIVYFYSYNLYCNISCNVRSHRIKHNRCTGIVISLFYSAV